MHTMEQRPLPPAYAGLSRDQALAQTFLKRVRQADTLGLSLEEQGRLHRDWEAAKTLQEKQAVLQWLFEWMVAR